MTDLVSVKEYFFFAVIYLLGAVGYAAIGLIPYRSWRILRRVIKVRRESFGKALICITAFVVTIAILADVQVSEKIFVCLTQVKRCEAGGFRSWVRLVELGVVYVIFEIASFIIIKLTQFVETKREA